MTKSNPNIKTPLYGIGINDADYQIAPIINGKQSLCPFYDVWKSMMARCYCKPFHKRHPSYKDCHVVEEWHYFSNFKKWMESWDWKGKCLDKDIQYPGNKTYGPDTCLFITQEINKLLLKADACRGIYPTGVCLHRETGKFTANIGMFKKSKYLGLFDSVEEASKAYRKMKRIYLLLAACCEPDIRVKQGLYRHSLTFL